MEDMEAPGHAVRPCSSSSQQMAHSSPATANLLRFAGRAASASSSQRTGAGSSSSVAQIRGKASLSPCLRAAWRRPLCRPSKEDASALAMSNRRRTRHDGASSG
uniref:Uncharacterized protein n=1 Tax=Arundo donax TaxID=35708 RepID=A0A0A8YFY0_ARUDO